MPPKLPPAQSKGGKNQQRAINALLAQAPNLRQYMPIIRQAAARWGFDPVFILAVLSIEDRSGDKHATSSSGARGLAQIFDQKVLRGLNPQQYASFVAEYGDRYKNGKDQATDPLWALNYLAWRMAGQYRKYGTLDKAYSKGYHGEPYPGPAPSSFIPKWYLSQAKVSSPQDTAGKSFDTSLAKAQLKQASGVDFLNNWHNRIDPIWEAYTGKRATRAQAQFVLRSGWSDYHMELQLATNKKLNPHFDKSPVFLNKAPGYESIYSDLYGQNKKAPREAIAYAIIHNLDGSGFASLLRQRQDYVKSNEFKTNVANLDTVYRKIYGQPNELGQNTIKQAVLNGWNENEFARYLRAQPEYSRSQEYQSNALGVLEGLGMVTGTGVSLSPGTPAPYDSNTQVGAPPPDKRVKGKTGITPPGTSYTPSLNG